MAMMTSLGRLAEQWPDQGVAQWRGEWPLKRKTLEHADALSNRAGRSPPHDERRGPATVNKSRKFLLLQHEKCPPSERRQDPTCALPTRPHDLAPEAMHQRHSILLRTEGSAPIG